MFSTRGGDLWEMLLSWRETAGERKKGFKQEEERGGKLRKILRVQNQGLIGWLGKWESAGITLQL